MFIKPKISKLLWLCLGYQTLGEEYVNIIQVDPSKCRIPSRTRRTAFVLCHSLVPYFLDKVLVCLENELDDGNTSSTIRRQTSPGPWSLEAWLRRWIRTAVGRMTVSQQRACLPVMYFLQQGLDLLHRFHTALFYIRGSFYHISRRAAGISYVRVLLINLYISTNFCRRYWMRLYCSCRIEETEKSHL